MIVANHKNINHINQSSPLSSTTTLSSSLSHHSSLPTRLPVTHLFHDLVFCLLPNCYPSYSSLPWLISKYGGKIEESPVLIPSKNMTSANWLIFFTWMISKSKEIQSVNSSFILYSILEEESIKQLEASILNGIFGDLSNSIIREIKSYPFYAPSFITESIENRILQVKYISIIQIEYNWFLKKLQSKSLTDMNTDSQTDLLSHSVTTERSDSVVILSSQRTLFSSPLPSLKKDMSKLSPSHNSDNVHLDKNQNESNHRNDIEIDLSTDQQSQQQYKSTDVISILEDEHYADVNVNSKSSVIIIGSPVSKNQEKKTTTSQQKGGRSNSSTVPNKQIVHVEYQSKRNDVINSNDTAETEVVEIKSRKRKSADKKLNSPPSNATQMTNTRSSHLPNHIHQEEVEITSLNFSQSSSLLTDPHLRSFVLLMNSTKSSFLICMNALIRSGGNYFTAFHLINGSLKYEQIKHLQFKHNIYKVRKRIPNEEREEGNKKSLRTNQTESEDECIDDIESDDSTSVFISPTPPLPVTGCLICSSLWPWNVSEDNILVSDNEENLRLLRKRRGKEAFSQRVEFVLGEPIPQNK